MARPKLTVVPPPEEEQDAGYHWQTADQAKAVKQQWMLPNRIVGNGLAIVEGETSAGKSTFLAHLAAAITTGNKWLGRPKTEPRRVLWLTGEEDFASMVRPRLVAAGCNVSLVVSPEPDADNVVRPLFLPGCAHILRAAIHKYQLAMIVIEPLISFVSPEISLTQETPARSVVDPLNRLAIDTGCCVVVTRGLRKDKSGPRTSHGSGHATIGGTARSILVIDQPDPETERRILRSIKATGATARMPALAYTIDRSDGPRMVGIADVVGAADDANAEAVDIGERDMRADARQMLRSMCATDYVPSKTVMGTAKESGIGERTLRKVKAELCVHSRWNRQQGSGFHEWGPPLKGWEQPGVSPPVQPTASCSVGKKPRKSRNKLPK